MKKFFASVSCFLLVLSLAGCGKTVTQDEAKAAALADAGLTENDVTFTADSVDDDSYEFEFHTDDKSYKYEVDKKGRISERETNSYQSPNKTADTPQAEENTGSAGSSLTQEEALTKAYEHFKVSADTAANIEVKQENEHGTSVFDIEFVSDGKEYSCEVDMQTGAILSSDIDQH